MRDVTRQFLEQSPEYGRKARENITRIDVYVNKANNILSIIGMDKVKVQVFFGRVMARHFQLERNKIPCLVKSYGKLYFLDLYYNQTKDTIMIRLNALIPKRDKNNSEQRFYWQHR